MISVEFPPRSLIPNSEFRIPNFGRRPLNCNLKFLLFLLRQKVGNLLLLLVIPAAAGGLMGAKLPGKLPDRVLKKIFAALVVVAGARMLF